MEGLYPIIRRKRRPLAVADLKAAVGGQKPDTGATQARTPAPLEAAAEKERRAKRSA